MKLECRRTYISIIPENDMEQGYLEMLLGLHDDGDYAIAKRENTMGGTLAYVKIIPCPDEDTLLREDD